MATELSKTSGKALPASREGATRSVTVNAAFLEEIKDCNEALWRQLGELDQMCGRPLSWQRQCGRLTNLLAALRDQLALQFSLEEAFGYFDDPIAVAPRLAERVATLRDEHGSLYRDACRMAERAEQLWADGELATLAATLPPWFAAFHDQLKQHEAGERELIMTAYLQDLGAGD